MIMLQTFQSHISLPKIKINITKKIQMNNYLQITTIKVQIVAVKKVSHLNLVIKQCQ